MELKSRGQQGWFLLEALRENPLPCLLQLPEVIMLLGSWSVAPNPALIITSSLMYLPPSSKDPCENKRTEPSHRIILPSGFERCMGWCDVSCCGSYHETMRTMIRKSHVHPDNPGSPSASRLIIPLHLQSPLCHMS